MNADEIKAGLRDLAKDRESFFATEEDCIFKHDYAVLMAAVELIDRINDFEQSQCAILLAQLTASQARERAAVEDMKRLAVGNASACAVCTSNRNPDAKCINKNGGVCVWQWRGTQAEEE